MENDDGTKEGVKVLEEGGKVNKVEVKGDEKKTRRQSD